MGHAKGIRSFLQPVCLGVILQLFLSFPPATARADSLGGFLELDFMKSDSSLRDASGVTNKNSTTSLLQRYNIALDRTIYPSLRFAAGGNFELGKDDTRTELSNVSNDITTDTFKMFPFATLSLNSGFTSAGIGYKRRQETTETTGAPAVTLINDNYNAMFGLRPEALPAVDVFFTRLNAHDDLRISQDTVNDSVLVNSKYTLAKGLDLGYQWLYNDLQDKLKNIEVQSVNQNARVAYTGQFFKDRVLLASSYNISLQEAKTVAKSSGDVLTPTFPPPTGLFKISVLPDTPDSGALDADANLIAGTESINIGVQTLPSSAISDTRPRNMGFQFVTDAAVNVIRVLLGPDESSNLGVDGFYRNFKQWDIYSSADGTSWTRENSLSPDRAGEVSFGLFSVTATVPQQRYGFELRFPMLSNKRFIKVVTTPLQFVGQAPRGIDVKSIFVTKLESFFSGPATAGAERTSRTIAGHYDMNSRVKLLDKPNLPNLFYELSFTFDHVNSDQSSTSRYDVTNSLSLLHRFNEIISGTARFSREDASDAGGKRGAYLYSAALTATPLPTLTNSLVFSGRNEQVAGQTDSSYSLFLNNNAELYRGINVVLDGGISRAISTAGITTDDALFLCGANLVPHPMLNINLNVTGRKEWQSGGGRPASSTYRQDDEFSVTLNPLAGIYLFGSLSILTETDKRTVTTQSFGGSWAPFREGNLLLNISYNENVSSESSQKDKALVQSLRWYIRGASYLDVSYLIANSSSLTQNIDTYTFSTTLRITF